VISLQRGMRHAVLSEVLSVIAPAPLGKLAFQARSGLIIVLIILSLRGYVTQVVN